MDSNFSETLQQDPVYDLTESTAALLSSNVSSSNSSVNASINFDVPIHDGASLGFYKDMDSISTFRSKARSVLKKKGITSSTTTPTATTTPTQSVSFAAFNQAQKLDDTSVSRMSDTASKVTGLEIHFKKMESQFTTALARLEAIFSGIGTHSLSSATADSTGSITKPVHSTANPLAPASAGGTSSSSAAGSGYSGSLNFSPSICDNNRLHNNKTSGDDICFGDNIPIKKDNKTLRIGFQNIGGFPLQPT
jgi:hypothetical protein